MPWTQIYSNVFQQEMEPETGGGYPIPPVQWPISETLTYPRLIWSAVSTTSRPTWELAAKGTLLHSVGDGLTVQSPEFAILLNQQFILYETPEFFTPFSVQLDFPKWLRSVAVTAYAEIP